MAVTAYIALLRKEADSDFGVEFPDFPGCITAGITLENARSMATEALQFHIEGMLEDGDPIPKPSRRKDVLTEMRCSDATAIFVGVPIRRPT